TASGTNAWATDQVTEDFSSAINDSWVIQSPASLSIGIIDAPELVYRGQGNIPVEVEIINLGEADAIISSVPVYISLGSYSEIIPGETMPVTINGQTSRMIKVLVSIEETTATGSATLDADVIGTDGNVGTPLSYSGAANPDTWTILAEKILTYGDASYLLPLTSFVLPDAGFNYVYVKAENLAPLKEYAIRWFNTGGSEIIAARTVGFADANGNLFSELPYDSSFAFGLYTVKITNPVGSYSPAQTNFSIVTSSSLSGSLVLPSKVSIGQNFPAYMSIVNSGGAQASGMVPTNLISGGTGLASLLSGPTPGSIDLAGNSSATFTWNFTAANSGSFLLSGHSQGFEAGSNKPVSVPAGCYDLLFEETFEDYAASETIDAKNSGYGFSGGWSGVAGIQETIMVSNTMDYTSGMGQPLYGGWKAARISGDNDNALTRNLPSSIDLPELYISMLVRFNGVQGNNKFLALWLEDPGFGSAPNLGIKMNCGDGSGVEDFFVRTQFNHAYHTNIVPGQTYLIVGRVTKFAGTGTYDQYELWVNPSDLTTPGPPDATTTGASLISDFSKIGFRTLNLGPGESFDIAAFRIGKSFASVTTQPLISNVCMIQSPAQVTINSLIATPSVVFYDQKQIEVLATLENHGEADARIDLADILQTPVFGTDSLASPSALPAVIPGNSIATFSFRVNVNNGAPIGVATMTGQIRFEDVNNPVPTLVTDQTYEWTIVDTRIICARDSGFTTIQYVFNAGQTVYARASGLPTGMDVRIRFYDTTTNDPPLPGDVGVGIQTLLNTGVDGMATHFHDIPAGTSQINQWMVVVDDGNETTLGNILGIQYFEVVKPPQIAYSVLIGSSSCFVGDTFSLDFKVTNTSTWSTNIQHYLNSYGYDSLYPQINGSGYFTLETPYPARGWHQDLDPGQSHTFTYLFKARSESGAGTASSAIQLVTSLWRINDLNDGSNTYSPAMTSSNSIRILKASFKIIPDGFAVPTTQGLLGEYYKTVTANPPPMPGGATAYSRTDSEVNFDWSTNNPYPAELGNDYYSVRWTGFVNPDNTGNYTFYTRTDDGTRLWVDGTPITNRWSNGLAEVNGTIALNAGVPVPIIMEFYERTGNSIAQLSWQGP
ncbi:MAG: PA14 domain-containing protein, partial [Candidatus Riflebacteria bacterium]